MIRILTTGRLNSLTRRAEEAEAKTASYGQRALELTQQLGTAHADLDAAEHTGQQLLKELAERSLEVSELVEEVKAAERSPQTVYVLTYRGELHSVHIAEASAEAAAHAEGAHIGGWRRLPRDLPLSQSRWRITPLPLVHEEAS